MIQRKTVGHDLIRRNKHNTMKAYGYSSVFLAKGVDGLLFRAIATLLFCKRQQYELTQFDRPGQMGMLREKLFMFFRKHYSFHAAAKICILLGMDASGTNQFGSPIAFLPLAPPADTLDIEATKLLLSTAGTVDLTDTTGRTALSIASQYGNKQLDFIEWLIAMGADPLKQDKTGKTAIFRAIEARRSIPLTNEDPFDLSLIELLLERGGEKSLHLLDRQGRTIADLAREGKDHLVLDKIEEFQKRWAAQKRREALLQHTTNTPSEEMSKRRL